MPRELTILSDTAYERSHRLAAKLGKSITEVVDAALVEFEAKAATTLKEHEDATGDDIFSPQAIVKRARQWKAIREKVQGWGTPLPFSDHDLYDESGLPK